MIELWTQRVNPNQPFGKLPAIVVCLYGTEYRGDKPSKLYNHLLFGELGLVGRA